METSKLLDTIYDILAQNTDMVSQEDRDYVTELIDCVDYDRQEIVFITAKGKRVTLKLEYEV